MLARCCPPSKILSGGQTGADRAALDVALELGIPCGGWCARERRAEDGPIPARYPLFETSADEYGQRTSLNVSAASATALFSLAPRLGQGSLLTRAWALSLRRPFLHLVRDAGMGAPNLAAWLEIHRPVVLNVAGSRESGEPGIRDWVQQVLRETLVSLNSGAATWLRKGSARDWSTGVPAAPSHSAR